MHYLEKHCSTSREGIIALSDTLVKKALQAQVPIKVTCKDYPRETLILSPEDLIRPVYTAGPYDNKYSVNPEETYNLFMYRWESSPIPQPKLLEETLEEEVPIKDFSEEKEIPLETEVSGEPKIIRTEKGYIMRTPVITTTYEDVPINLIQYIGVVIQQTRLKKRLRNCDMVSLSNNKLVSSSISMIEKGEGNPTLSTLEAMAEALDLHISELFPPKL
jgi:hypothetical protein